MKVTVLPTVVGALGIVTKELVKDRRIWKYEDKWRPSKLQYC